MNDMPYRYLTPPSAARGNAAERFFGRLMGLMVWALLATMGVVFALSLLVWLVVMVVVSLVASVFTGRPAAVTVLWRRYRDLTRGLARQQRHRRLVGHACWRAGRGLARSQAQHARRGHQRAFAPLIGVGQPPPAVGKPAVGQI